MPGYKPRDKQLFPRGEQEEEIANKSRMNRAPRISRAREIRVAIEGSICRGQLVRNSPPLAVRAPLPPALPRGGGVKRNKAYSGCPVPSRY